MNKFTEAAKRMAEKAARGPAYEGDLARATYEQIKQHLSANPAAVQLDYDGNVVRLHKPDADRLFKITCLANGTFELDERSASGVQRAVAYQMPRVYRTHAPISEDEMIDKVAIWLGE